MLYVQLLQGKREKKSSKKSKTAAVVVEEEPTEPAATGGGAAAELFNLDVGSQMQKPPALRFQLLAEDENIKMVCELRMWKNK